MAEREHHFEARREQIEHEHAARSDRSQWASVNHGRPAVAASGRPGDFHHNVIAAREASNREAVRADRDRPDNHGVGRNDRPSNAGGRDKDNSRSGGGADRPNNTHVDNRRADRATQDARGRGPDPQGVARGNPHVDRSPSTVDRGNPHADRSAPTVDRGNPHSDRGPASHGPDRGPAQHGPDHGSAANGSGHGNSGHGDSKQDHGKDRGKP
jgi:hypothetical protein